MPPSRTSLDTAQVARPAGPQRSVVSHYLSLREHRGLIHGSTIERAFKSIPRPGGRFDVNALQIFINEVSELVDSNLIFQDQTLENVKLLKQLEGETDRAQQDVLLAAYECLSQGYFHLGNSYSSKFKDYSAIYKTLLNIYLYRKESGIKKRLIEKAQSVELGDEVRAKIGEKRNLQVLALWISKVIAKRASEAVVQQIQIS